MSGDALTQRRRGAERGSWPRVRLGEVCEVLIGNSAPQEASCFKGGTYSFVRTSDVGGIHFGILNNSRDLLNDAGIKGMRLFSKGSILFPKSGASAFLNHRVMLGIDAFVSSHLAVIEASGRVDSKYLLHYLMTVDTKNLLQNSAYPSLRRGDIVAIPVPLPPLAEQRRIASKLDLLCDIVTKRKAQLSQLQQLVKSRFVEMFGDEKRFPAVTVGDVFTVKGPKRIHKEEWTSEGVPFYRVSNLSDLLEGRETTSDNFISRSRFEELKADEQVPAAGDVLVTARGTLGRCYVVKPHDEFYFQDGMITWLADRNERITLPYFLQAVQSQTFKRQYEGKSSGTTVAYMTIGQLAKYKLPLPPLALQREFAAFVAKVDKLAFAVKKSLESSEKLYRQQLSEAFS